MTEIISKIPLWTNQVDAFNFGKELPGFFLAHDMGCGKTLTLITFIHNLNRSLVLIICPKPVGPVWIKEFARYDPGIRRLLLLNDGPSKKRTDALKQAINLAVIQQQNLVVITNYEGSIRSPFKEALLQVPWSLVAYDESHRIKAPGGVSSWLAKALGKKAPHRICMSGTPLPRDPLDAYAQYRFLDSSIFGTSYVIFKTQYTTSELVLDKHGKPLKAKTAKMAANPPRTITGFQNMEEFNTKLHSIMHRVKSDDIHDLPERVDIQRSFDLPPNARKIYNDLKKEFCAQLESGVITASNGLVKLLRLQQITSGYVQPDADIHTGIKGEITQLHNGKSDLLADWLVDIPPQEPIIVFCRFRHDLQMVHNVFREREELCGELSGTRNDLAEWQSHAPLSRTMRGLAVQIQAGREGVDFTRARYCVYYSPGIILGQYLQSRKRVHRPGQHRNVVYLHLLANHTIDAQVYDAFDRQLEVIDLVLEQGLT